MSKLVIIVSMKLDNDGGKTHYTLSFPVYKYVFTIIRA